MALTIPALSGSESIVGITRESTWGTTPTTGSNPDKLMTRPGTNTAWPFWTEWKEENLQSQLSRDPQTDDMVADREINRIITNGSMVRGGLRKIAGPESIGYLLTAMFGNPTTTTAAPSSGTSEQAYQHIWSPALNTRANWPIPLSIESILAATRSKLVRGAILERLPIDIPNNAPVTIAPEFLAKDIRWLNTSSTGTDARGNARIAKISTTTTLVTETEFHWKQMLAYPQIDNVNQQSITSFSFEPGFVGLEGLFTGGSGSEIGTYRVDNFRIGGRLTMLFEDDTLWETLEQGTAFELDVTLRGDVIVGSTYNQLQILCTKCVADTDDVVNRVGNLEYDFAWTAKQDSALAIPKSCEITLINTVAKYAVNIE